MAGACLTFEQQKCILKWFMRFDNAIEVQRQWRREYETEPPTSLTIKRIIDKFEAHGMICDIHKGRSGRLHTALSAFVLERFVTSPQKSATQCALYSPTEDSTEDEKTKFYTQLSEECERISYYDMLIVLGDFNAKIGIEDFLKDIAGWFTLHLETNANGKLLSQLAAAHNLIIKSTCFEHKKIHKGTWKIPGTEDVNQIHHLLISRRDSSTIIDVKTARGLNCDSDHFMTWCVYKDENGELIGNKDDIIKRWAELFQEVLQEKEVEPPDELDVQIAIEKQKNNRAPGEDSLTAELFKHEGRCLTKEIHALITFIWENERMPEVWNSSIICPIFKKGNITECKNYGGIMLLDVIYKVLFSIILNKVNKYAENILEDSQCGFRQERSTKEQICNVSNNGKVSGI
ncbi:hypothetical protein ANN_17546 [Periplaneta americana]|uniref:DUF4817 domain-containing protein n=1 Tax=Periplaneta americana TaxID=6978 RepID=A0ABQ8SUQ3_PERAM|nr:hypothetical protein ANN_17546 [Periplaneta americana]